MGRIIYNKYRWKEGSSKIIWAAIVSGILISLGVILSVNSESSPAYLPAPTILKPAYGSMVARGEFVLAGVTKNGTKVDVYIDGDYAGEAKTKDHPSGTASFSFIIDNQSDFQTGVHRVWVQARGEKGKDISGLSDVIEFNLYQPYPRPTVFMPVINSSTVYTRPWIVGLARSTDMVEIMIDGVVVARTETSVDESGVGDFKYLTESDLDFGWHSIRARSVDGFDRTSPWSESFVFAISKKGKPPSKAPQLVSQTRGERITNISTPTILRPKNGDVVESGKWQIAGVVYNNLIVQLFIDSKLLVEIVPKQHKSGVTSFIYSPSEVFPRGDHRISVRAVDEAGNYSARSSDIGIIIKPRLPQLAVLTADGVIMWPPLDQAAEIGSGVKVAKGDIKVNKKLEIEDESNIENFQPVKEKKIIDFEEGEGALPEITGPVFKDGLTIEALEDILEDVVVTTATQTTATPEIVRADTKDAKIKVDNLVESGIEGEKGESIKQSNENKKDQPLSSAGEAQTVSNAKRYRPEAIILIAAGVILLLGIGFTVLRDRQKSIKQGPLDFSDDKKTAAFAADDEYQEDFKQIQNPQPPPPSPPA